MYRYCHSIACLCLLTTIAFAHDDHPEPPAKIEAAVQHKPSVLPDRIVLTWSSDPAHTQDVTWRTSIDVHHAFVEYAVATKGPYFVANAVRIEATTAPFESDLGTCHLHTAQMKALAPATKYAYRVGDGNNWSEWFHFRSASNSPEPFTFIYFGDAQNDLRSMWSRIVREAQSDAPKAAFMLHAGDLVNVANRDAEWGEWFGGGHWLNAMVPSLATPGNHEYGRETVEVDGEKTTVRKLSEHWKPYFSFPMNGPEGLKETVYWMDFQGTRIISLNSNEQHELQAQWVEQVLANNPNRWTIITFHHPMYSSAKGRDNVGLRQLWKPIFDKYKVDLVLQGHDHSYARTGLELPVSAENLETGINVKEGPTVYVVSVSGPKQYEVGDRDFFARSASGAQLYQIIDVERDTLHYQARVANGELYDEFVLRKQEGEFNMLEDRVPDTPESRKPAEIRVAPVAVAVNNATSASSAGAPEGSIRRDPLSVEDIFAARDANKDGKLSGDEIPQHMRSQVAAVDADGDGAVSITELEASFRRLRESLGAGSR